MIRFRELLLEAAKIPVIWYHTTSNAAAKSILKQGFKILQGNNNWGTGIYFANPVHVFDDHNTVVVVQLNSSFKIYSLDDGDEAYLGWKKMMLRYKPYYDATLKQLTTNLGNDLKKAKAFIKDGIGASRDPDLIAETMQHFGYDGMSIKMNDTGFYVGNWLVIYNLEKLNRIQRSLSSISAVIKGSKTT